MTRVGTLKVKFGYKGVERPKTVCKILNDAGEVIAESYVKKSVNDSNDKLVGRFQAFRKAMKDISLNNLATRQQRTEVWNSFTNTVKLPKSVNVTH